MDSPRILGDRYEVRGELGRGGMASVYEGRDRVLDRDVAIKVLASRYAGDDRFVARFEREARAAAGLNHPNIVSVFDTGETGGERFIVMELVRGETLSDLLRREGPLSPERAARIAAGVAAALHAAHGQGIVHRDVKPANVMLTQTGDVKVMDFGIARAAADDPLTQTGLVMGTASYLSPEQSRGEPVDHRSDVYALGCVVYEMLTGTPPFTGESPVAVAYRHAHDRPEPPSAAAPGIDPEIDAVVMRALEKDPDARFDTAEALRQALTSAVAGERTAPIEDTDVLPTAELPVAPRRRPWAAVAAVVALAVIGGAVALAMARTTAELPRERPERGASPRPLAEVDASPSAPSLVDLATAIAALETAVTSAAAADLLPDEVAAKLLEEADKATGSYANGGLEDALNHLDEAERALQEALGQGLVAEETAAELQAAVDAVRQAMIATPPPEIADTSPPPEAEEDEGPDEAEEGDEGEHEDGPGKSEDAPGQIKKGEGE